MNNDEFYQFESKYFAHYCYQTKLLIPYTRFSDFLRKRTHRIQILTEHCFLTNDG